MKPAANTSDPASAAATRAELELVHEIQTGSNPSRPVYLLCVFRDENLLLPYFVDYYRSIGVSHFILVDNRSVDAGPEFLKGLTNINLRLFRAESSYREAEYGTKWVNHLLRRYCQGHYCFTADVDELFLFDPDRYESLTELIHSMEASGANAVAATLLDMYPERTNDRYRRGERFASHSPYFDAFNQTYYEARGPVYDIWCHKVGGVRKRVLDTTVCIHKFPLFRFDFAPIGVAPGYHFFQLEGKILRRSTRIRLHNHAGVVLHFKFIKPDFGDFVERRLSNNEDWDNSSEYRSYAEVLKLQESIRFWSADFSQRLEPEGDLSAFFQDLP